MSASIVQRYAANRFTPPRQKVVLRLQISTILVKNCIWSSPSMEMILASDHDVQNLKELRHSGLQYCLVLTYIGYLSGPDQLHQFFLTGIEVKTTMRSIQQEYRPWPTLFKKS